MSSSSSSGSRSSESSPLLHSSNTDELPLAVNSDGLQFGESFDNVPKSKRQLGVLSAILLIFNKVIGTGIYATPSTILLASSGSIGISLLMWLAGALVAAAGTAVYVELGTALPRSGGEKNYLEYLYSRPLFLVTCAYGVYALITGSATANSIVFGEYLSNALSPTIPSNTTIPSTLIHPISLSILALTTPVLLHGTLPITLGLRIQNILGILKLLILGSMALVGLAVLLGVPGLGWDGAKGGVAWDRLWESSNTNGGANRLVAGMFSVIWSFIGYSNANYALSEIRDPIRTIKLAAPLAMFSVATVYMLVNVAYFAVVQKQEILESKRIVAALFFRNLFGQGYTERALSLVIALSTLGNILAGQFVQARVIQELGRSGIIPFSSLFASNRPFGLPLSGLFTQFLISLALLLGVPRGDAYTLLISTSSYSGSLINMFVSLGLILLPRTTTWNPPFRAYKSVTWLFFLSNVFLVLVPILVPPGNNGTGVYDRLPYWTHVVVAISVSWIGVAYWYIWCRWIPERKGYVLERVWVVNPDDGVERGVLRKVRTVARIDVD